jgi:hypothetical protein
VGQPRIRPHVPGRIAPLIHGGNRPRHDAGRALEYSQTDELQRKDARLSDGPAFGNRVVDRIAIAVQILRIHKILPLWTAKKYGIFSEELTAGPLVISRVQVSKSALIRKLPDVLTLFIRYGVRTDAGASIRVVIQSLRHIFIFVSHDIRRAEVIGVNVPRLGRPRRHATCGLLVHCRKQRIAVEHVVRGGRVLRTCARRARHGVPLERIQRGRRGAGLDDPLAEGVVAIGRGCNRGIG